MKLIPFLELAEGDFFRWAPEDAHRHFPGVYKKLSDAQVEPMTGGYASYDLLPAGQRAMVLPTNESVVTAAQEEAAVALRRAGFTLVETDASAQTLTFRRDAEVRTVYQDGAVSHQ